MREAIGSTWVMQLVIIFMLIFVAFLSLTINYTKAFKIKNEFISVIEKYEGLGSEENGSIAIFNNYLRYHNYTAMGHCEENEYGIKDLDTHMLEEVDKNQKYFYCVRKKNTATVKNKERAKYEVKIFFNFNLPVIGDIFTFAVNGTTIDIIYPINDIDFT